MTEGIDYSDQEIRPKPQLNRKEMFRYHLIVNFLFFLITFYLLLDKDIWFLCMVILVLMIHELGHFTAMKIFGYDEPKLFFMPFFGYVSSTGQKIVSQKQRAITLIAGPLPGIIIGSGLLIFFHANTDVARLGLIFIYLNLFTLLPLVPLDGGTLLITFFPKAKKIMGFIFMILSFAAMIYFSTINKNYFFFVIAICLLIAINNGYRKIKVRRLLLANGFQLDKTFDELTDSEYRDICDCIVENIPWFKNFMMANNSSVKEARIAGFINSFLVKPVDHDLTIAGKMIMLVIWIVSFFVVLIFDLAIPFLSI